MEVIFWIIKKDWDTDKNVEDCVQSLLYFHEKKQTIALALKAYVRINMWGKKELQKKSFKADNWV